MSPVVSTRSRDMNVFVLVWCLLLRSIQAKDWWYEKSNKAEIQSSNQEEIAIKARSEIECVLKCRVKYFPKAFYTGNEARCVCMKEVTEKQEEGDQGFYMKHIEVVYDYVTTSSLICERVRGINK